jgi:hypothetical protein
VYRHSAQENKASKDTLDLLGAVGFDFPVFYELTMRAGHVVNGSFEELSRLVTHTKPELFYHMRDFQPLI